MLQLGLHIGMTIFACHLNPTSPPGNLTCRCLTLKLSSLTWPLLAKTGHYQFVAGVEDTQCSVYLSSCIVTVNMAKATHLLKRSFLVNLRRKAYFRESMVVSFNLE